MDPVVVDLVIIAVLILLNAIFAGTELAIVTLRPSQLRALAAEHGKRGERVEQMAEDPSRFLSTVQVGITLGGFLAAATAAVGLSEQLVGPLSFLGELARPAAVVAVTLVLTFVTLVGGELVPKRIAIQHAERWAMYTSGPMLWVARLAAPLVWLLSRTTDAVVRLLGVSAERIRREPGIDELRDLVARHGELGATERSILKGAFDIDERTARDIVVPRRDVDDIPIESTAREARELLIQLGHSRAPVLEGDDPIGVVHLIDVADAPGDVSVRELLREALMIPESVTLPDLLRQFQRARRQMALVLDEYGSMTGIVTLEDVLEEIVGEIYDEFDRDLDESDPRSVQRLPDGSMILPGAFPAHDLEDLDILLPEHDNATVAGVVLEAAGRIPDEGEAFAIEGWTFTVRAVEHNAIRELHVVRAAVGEQDADREDEAAAGGASDESGTEPMP